MTQGACKTILRTDDPAAADEFGTHQRLAEVLAETISKEDGGRAIALIGPFGSGKSTIVYLLERALETNCDDEIHTSVFTYDAWSHQGDPLRRSFLEDLRNYLVKSAAWLRESDLATQFDSLVRRREETESRSVPVLTWQGTLVLLSFFGVAIGIETLHDHWWGYLLAVAPILTAIGAWLTFRSTWNPFTKEFWKSEAGGGGASSVLELLWKQNRETTRSTSISAPDPTSLEFQRLFEATMSVALKSEDRRLVIVMDNLDRLSATDALQIIATMRTFFGSSNPNRLWSSRLWLLVPFSPAWPSRLWKTDEVDSGRDDLSASFLDKSFQIQLHVSEQLLSNWKSFLISQLRATLPGHSDEDFQKVYVLYSRLAGRFRENLTPRAIKQFVNRIGMAHREWQHSIPLATIAAYSLLTQEKVQVWIDEAGKTEILNATDIATLDDQEWLGNFAAQYFNAPREEASQALMSDKVRAALSLGDSDALKGLAQVRGFEAVCEKVVDEDRALWESQSPVMILLAAAALKGVSLRPESEIWKLLRSAADSVESWTLTGAQSGEGIVALILTLPPAERQPNLEHFLRRMPAPQSLEKVDEANAPQLKKWLEGLFRVFRFGMQSLGYVPKDFRIGSNAAQYVDVMEVASTQFAETEQDLVTLLRPAPKPKDIVVRLVDLLRSEKNTGAIQTLRSLSRIDEALPFTDIAHLLTQDFTTPPALSEPRTRVTLSALLFLGFEINVNGAEEQIKQLVTSGRLYDQVSQMMTSADTSAGCLYLYMTFGPPTQVVGNSEAAVVRLRQILENPAATNNGQIVLALARIIDRCGGLATHLGRWQNETTNSKLVAQLLTAKFSASGYSLINLGISLTENFAYLKSCLSAEVFDRLTTAAAEDAALDAELTKAGFSLNHIDLYKLVLAAKREELPVVPFLLSSTAEIPATEWLNQLNSSGPGMDLILSLVKRGQSGWLRQPFEDALNEHAKAVIRGETFPTAIADRWNDIISALERSKLKVLLREVSDQLVENVSGVNEKIFNLYGKALCDSEVLEEVAERVVRKLFRNLCAQKQIWAISWVIDAIQRHPDIFEKAGAESAEDFVERVKSLKTDDSVDTATRESVEKLWSLLVAQHVTSDDTTPPEVDAKLNSTADNTRNEGPT